MNLFANTTKIIVAIGLATIGYYLSGQFAPKTHEIDCRQARKIVRISDVFLSAIGDPSQFEAETIAHRYITKAVCLNDLKGDVSFSPKPYFFKPADLSHKYLVVDWSSAGLRSPGNLKIKFDNGVLLNFCFSLMVINCDRAKVCDCPHDFNWEPQIRSN